MKLNIFFLVLCMFGPSLSADEDYGTSLKSTDEEYGASSRFPYEFQFSVDDPKTLNRYEIEESGNPEIVKGSYQIALPDGRTQLVTYEVHPELGYQAKVTYSGVAQYPDSPNYVPSAYGPPEPIRPGYNKFKRQSKVEESKQIIFGKHKKKIGKKVVTEKKEIKKPNLKASVQDQDQFQDQSQTNIQIKRKVETVDNSVKEKEDFDDTEHSPQAEPLSLQQSTPVKTEKIERPTEYKPSNTAEFIYQNEDRQPRANNNKRRTKTVVNGRKYSFEYNEGRPKSKQAKDNYSTDLLTASSKTQYSPSKDQWFYGQSEGQSNQQEITTKEPNTLDVIHFSSETPPVQDTFDGQQEKSANTPSQYFIAKPEAQTEPIVEKESHQGKSFHAKPNNVITYTLPAENEKPTVQSEIVTPSTLSGLTIHEAVPASSTTEAPEVYHIDISGYTGQEFSSPTDAFEELADAVFSEKNPKKRKIDITDYEKSYPKQNIPNPSLSSSNSFPQKILLPPPYATNNNVLPTIYRSQIKFIKTNENGAKNIQFVPTPKQHPIDNSNADDIKQENGQKVQQEKVQGDQELSVSDDGNDSIDNQKTIETIYYLPTVTPVETEKNQQQVKHLSSQETSHGDQDLTVSHVEKSSENETQELWDTIFFVPTPVKYDVNQQQAIKQTAVENPHGSVETNKIKHLYQTKFEEDPIITTRRPHYKIIRKSRVPKHVTFSPSREYKPVHRSEKVKLVYKEEGFVPEYVPRY